MFKSVCNAKTGSVRYVTVSVVQDIAVSGAVSVVRVVQGIDVSSAVSVVRGIAPYVRTVIHKSYDFETFDNNFAD